MIQFLTITIICLVIIFILYIIFNQRSLREVKKNYYNQISNQIKDQELSELTAWKEQKKQEMLNEINSQGTLMQQAISDKIKLLQEQQAFLIESNNTQIENNNKLKDSVDKMVKDYYDNQLTQYTTDLNVIYDELKLDINNSLTEQINNNQVIIDNLLTQKESVQQELDDLRARRAAINEDILRQRKIEEQADFYRICLSDDDISDIRFLLSILDNIKHQETLSKLIWTEYLQKPFQQMIKNVLAGRNVSNAIYKITNTKTNESYIGKTSGLLANRWTEHIKTSLNIGSIKSAVIHHKLFNNWQNFTFELLEEVPSDSKLGDREKYWIDFYQTNIYGYNMKNGG